MREEKIHKIIDYFEDKGFATFYYEENGELSLDMGYKEYSFSIDFFKGEPEAVCFVYGSADYNEPIATNSVLIEDIIEYIEQWI